jgi:hypothetical protein
MNKFRFIATGIVEPVRLKQHTIKANAIFAGIVIHSDWIKKVSQQRDVQPIHSMSGHVLELTTSNDRIVFDLKIPSNISVEITENLSTLSNNYFEWKQKKFFVMNCENTLEGDFWFWTLECGSPD